MDEASRKQGQSGAILLQLLEQRADNAVYRAGFATSRRAARQLMSHGHFMLNGRRVDIPSIRMKAGDVLVLREKSQTNEYFKKLDETSPAPSETPGRCIPARVTASETSPAPSETPGWLKANRKKFEITITGVPTREEAEPDIKEQLIVEYYSR